MRHLFLLLLFVGSGLPFNAKVVKLSQLRPFPSRSGLTSIDLTCDRGADSRLAPLSWHGRDFAATFLIPIILSASLTFNPLPSHAAYGPSGAVVNSPPVVKSLSLEEFLNLPKAKRRQFEGSFISCTTAKGAKQCKPVSVIDGLLNDMKVVSWVGHSLWCSLSVRTPPPIYPLASY